MRCLRNRLQIICVSGLLLGNVACSEEGEKEQNPPPQKPVAFLDIANSGEGSYPGGATPKKGKWSIDSSKKTLNLGVEPLDIGWLEFGPEFREKGSTIQAAARGPGDGRLKSRFGVGLYGKNGFQIRLQQGTDKVELVRRGAVLASEGFEMDVGELYRMELSVVAEGEVWVISGRVWKEGNERTEAPLLSHRMKSEELLFPLAGRPCLVATPFSGEPVAYTRAEVFDGAFVPTDEAEEEEESGEESPEEENENEAKE